MKFRRLFCSLAAFAGCFALSLAAHAQVFCYNIHIDPLTMTAITLQTNTLEGAYNKRIQSQALLLVEEEVIHRTLDGIHNIQKKTIDYLSQAQGAIQKLSQLKEIAQLAINDIPTEVLALLKEAKQHPDKAIISAVTNSLVADVVQEASELTPLIASLVTGETASKRSDGSIDTSGPNNLLNGAERFKVANDVLYRLRNLDSTIRSLRRGLRYTQYPSINIDVSVGDYSIK